METIKRKLRVTIEKEIEIEIMPSMFCGNTEEAYLKEFREGLWHVDSIDDVIKYAAKVAATGGGGHNHDGIGRVESAYMRKLETEADVYFDEVSDDIEAEFVGA